MSKFVSYFLTQQNFAVRVSYWFHSDKKRKDSLEIFSLDLEISGVAIQSIHQNRKKW